MSTMRLLPKIRQPFHRPGARRGYLLGMSNPPLRLVSNQPLPTLPVVPEFVAVSLSPCFVSQQNKRVKRISPNVTANNLPGIVGSDRTFYVCYDDRSGTRFLVGNGEQFSVIPSTAADHRCLCPD
ncbi:hypothetical protein SprV_0301252600 [Sparganum proliferum]